MSIGVNSVLIAGLNLRFEPLSNKFVTLKLSMADVSFQVLQTPKSVFYSRTQFITKLLISSP
jgi:hypothetical protein